MTKINIMEISEASGHYGLIGKKQFEKELINLVKLGRNPTEINEEITAYNRAGGFYYFSTKLIVALKQHSTI
jgi:hypothetical protein